MSQDVDVDGKNGGFVAGQCRQGGHAEFTAPGSLSAGMGWFDVSKAIRSTILHKLPSGNNLT